jgi:phosphoribosylanthranilate isomerase
MSDLLIKICGVRSPEIARVVAECGADLMGLIFAPARRQVTEEQAQRIVAGLPNSGHRPKVVGVFVNEPVDEMNWLAESVGLDFIQLSGDEPAEVQATLNRPMIRALRLPVGVTPAEAYEQAEQHLDCPAPAQALLLDTHVSGSYGGNGVPGDWNVARALAERYPVILAGGLRPETVDEALRTVRPFGVDVSSGVETDGVKDPEKIRQFIAAARAASSVPAGRSHE